MPLEVSAGAVVYRRINGGVEYLLLHYESGHWDFPKGNVEKGESEIETVTREISEETGLTEIKFLEGFKEEIRYFYRREGKTIAKRVVFCLAESKAGEVKLSYEHIGFEWLPYGQAIERLTFKNAKEILKKANDFLSR